MKVYCKRDCAPFYKYNFYNIYADIHTIFEVNDFISIKDKMNNDTTERLRFRLNHSTECIEGYIGDIELYFYDYFCDIKNDRKEKLLNIFNV